jgi:hypothetical protein
MRIAYFTGKTGKADMDRPIKCPSLTLEREERLETEICPYHDSRQTSELLGFDRC